MRRPVSGRRKVTTINVRNWNEGGLVTPVSEEWGEVRPKNDRQGDFGPDVRWSSKDQWFR